MDGKNDLVDIIKSTNDIGNTYWEEDDLDKALECYKISMDFSEMLDNERLTKNFSAAALNNIGIIYREQNLLPEAIKSFKKALALREEIEDYDGMARSLLYLSICSEEDYHFDDAHFYVHQIETIRHIQKLKKSGVTPYLDNLVNEIYLEECCELNDHQGFAGRLCDLGRISEQMGHIDDAEYCYELGRKMQSVPKACEALMLNQLGGIFFGKGDYKKAKKYFLDSLDYSKTLDKKDPLDQIRLTVVHCTLLKWIQKGRENDFKAWIAHSLQKLGEIALVERDYPKALTYFNKYLEQQDGDKAGMANAHFYLGLAYKNKGDTDLAHYYFEKSLDTIKDEDPLLIKLNHKMLSDLGV